MLHKKRPPNYAPVPDADQHEEEVLSTAPGGLAAIQILERLRGNNPTHVTYAQVEEALTKAGLDPFDCPELYDWLLGQLDQLSIKVIDEVPLNNSPTLDQLTAEADELEAFYNGISLSGDVDFPPLLTANEERRLLEIVRNGNGIRRSAGLSKEHRDQLQRQVQIAVNARNELVERNQRLVYYIAIKYVYRSKHLQLEDLVQEGNFGLLSAIEKFDLDIGARFSTYAVWWIRQAISRASADKDRTIRLPVHRVEDIARLRKAELRLEKTSGQKPTDLALAQDLEMLSPATISYLAEPVNLIGPQPVEIYAEIQRVLRHIRHLRQVSLMDPISYDMPVKDGDDASTLADFLPNSSAETIEDTVSRKLLKNHLCEIMEGLNERERRILFMRFGLEDGMSRTLEEIGRIFEVTRERVRQIEAKALRKLRHPQRSRKLRDYLY